MAAELLVFLKVSYLFLLFTFVCVCVFMYLYFLRKMTFKQGDDIGLLIGPGDGEKYMQSYINKVLITVEKCLDLYPIMCALGQDKT